MNKKMKISFMLLIVLSLITSIAFASDTSTYGDKLGIFKDVRILKDQTLRGTIITIFGDSQIDGMVDGDVAAIFGSVKVNGTVDGDVISIFGRVDMGSNSVITRDKVQIIGGAGHDPDTARVGGDEVNIVYFNNVVPGIGAVLIFLMILILIKSIVGFFFSLILVAAAPDRMKKITDSVSVNMPRKFGIGLLVIVGYYLFTLIGVTIVIGIPIVPILALVVALLGFTGNTAVKIAIGRKIGKSREWSELTQLLVGTVIYTLLELTIILKPVLYLAKLVGIGAAIDTRIGTVDFWGQNKKNSMPAYNVVDEMKDKKNNIDSENNNILPVKEDNKDLDNK